MLAVSCLFFSGCEISISSLNPTVPGGGAPALALGPLYVSNGLIFYVDAALAHGGTQPYLGGCAPTDLVWTDLSVSHADATLTGFSNPCMADGWTGNGSVAAPYALKFNGGTDFVPINVPAINTTVGGWNTVELWLRWGGANSVMPFGFNQYDFEFAGVGFGFNTNNGDVLGIPDAPLAGQWMQVVGEFNNGTPTSNFLFINGAQQALSYQLGLGSSARAAVANAVIGGWVTDGGYRFDDSVAIVRIYSRQLSQAEISQNCHVTASRFGIACN